MDDNNKNSIAKKASSLLNIVCFLPAVIGIILGIYVGFKVIQNELYLFPLFNLIFIVVPFAIALAGIGCTLLLLTSKKLATEVVTYTTTKNPQKKRNSLGLIIVFAVILLFFGFPLIESIIEDNKPLSFSQKISSKSDVVIYNDTIYYTGIPKYGTNDFNNNLYSMNLNGKNKKKIIRDEAFYSPTLSFIYNDNLYFYDGNYPKILNLKTKKIEDFNYKGYFLTNTLNGNYIYSIINNQSDMELDKFDLNTNEVIKRNSLNTWFDFEKAYIDYDTMDIYYLKNSYTKNNLYLNNDIIYTFNTNNQIIVYADNTFIYYIEGNKLFKLDRNNTQIEYVEEVPYGLKRIISYNDEDNFFKDPKGNIYLFSIKSKTIKLFLDNLSKDIQYVYRSSNNYIFTQFSNDIEYFGIISYDQSYQQIVYVYNKNNKEIKSYNTCAYTNIYIDKAYITYRDGEKLLIDSYK